MKNFFLLMILGIGVFFIYTTDWKALGQVYFVADSSQLPAGTFFADTDTSSSIQERFVNARAGNGKIKIAIVPGHDAESPGTSFGKLHEVDMTLSIGLALRDFLQKDSAFDVTIVRDEDGRYIPELQTYFIQKDAEITDFMRGSKKTMSVAINHGLVAVKEGVDHITPASSVVKRLYAINKWVDENNFDIVLHIHINDYGGRRTGKVGDYSGITIYVPESQYSNALISKKFGNALVQILEQEFATSDLPKESGGVVEDQDLIAVGSNNTVKATRALVEYGYIYEPQFQNDIIRPIILREMAWQLYRGIHNFFGEETTTVDGAHTTLLPMTFGKATFKDGEISRDILSVQTALLTEGLYPPEGFTKNDCPLSGQLGPCTKKALQAFKSKYNITDGKKIIGSATQKELLNLFAE